jgi:predicted ABC-class ATPase
VCGLKDHHPVDGRTYVYRVDSIAFARAGAGSIVKPLATWEFAKRTRR